MAMGRRGRYPGSTPPPGTAAGHALLHAIPINLPPPRHPPRGGLLVPELCAGTVVTAERLRHLAHLTAIRGHHPKAALAASWHRTAQAAAITGHCSELILRQLANPAPTRQPHGRARRSNRQRMRPADHGGPGAPSPTTGTPSPPTAAQPSPPSPPKSATWCSGPAARLHRPGLDSSPQPRQPPAPAPTSPAAAPRSPPSSRPFTTPAMPSPASPPTTARTSARPPQRDQIYIPTRLLPEEDDVPYRYTPAPPAMARRTTGQL